MAPQRKSLSLPSSDPPDSALVHADVHADKTDVGEYLRTSTLPIDLGLGRAEGY